MNWSVSFGVELEVSGRDSEADGAACSAMRLATRAATLGLRALGVRCSCAGGFDGFAGDLSCSAASAPPSTGAMVGNAASESKSGVAEAA